MSKYYSVAKGRQPGIFTNWEETKKHVIGYPNAKYKSFKTLHDAQIYLNQPNPQPNPPPQSQVQQKGIHIYTDGSCVDKIGGYGVVVVKDNVIVETLKGLVPFTPCTNNIAELYAIQMALKYDNVTIFSDSKYSINALTKTYKEYENSNWLKSDGKPVKNVDLIRKNLNLLENKDIHFLHVYGHKGNVYNELADKLANSGRFDTIETTI